MKRLLSLVALLTLILLPAQGALAASGEHITNFAVDATLTADNVYHVSESITVDFAGNAHHGIFRDIPVVQRSGNDSYYYQFDFLDATSPTGAYTDPQQSNNGDYVEIRLGDPKVTVNGVETYLITYTLSPMALQSAAGDRVNLNVTGQHWDYPIDQASMKLTLPAAPQDTPVCYTGTLGSQVSACTVTAADKTIIVASTTTIEPGSGMTVDMHLPAGSFSTYLVANQRPPMSTSLKVMIVLVSLAWLVGLFSLWGFIRIALNNRRLKRNQTVVAQYETPDGLTPAQIGVLVDSKSDMKEFTATIIDLAVRGYLKINQTEKKVLFVSNKDYRFDRLKSSDGLNDYEAAVYNMIFFDAAASSVSLSDITNRSMENSATLNKMHEEVAETLNAGGYYGKNSNLIYATSWIVVPVGIAIAGLGLMTGAFGYAAYIAGLFTIGLSFMLQRSFPTLTEAGAAEWAKVEGFKLFLNVAEKDRLNFSDAPERTPELFNKLLPYAVALGVEKQWAKQFEGIDVTPSNGWYGGTGPNFSSAVFASTFASSFSSSVSSGFAASGGSGGAGGGGGGGGGGGW